MYQVLENGKPCDCNHHKVHSSWNKSSYSTFEEAQEYAMKWLGEYAPPKGTLKLNTAYHYTGSDDYIEIKEI
jgi:hypothetical protein